MRAFVSHRDSVLHFQVPRFSPRSLPILPRRSWSPRLSKSRNSRRDSTCLNLCCNFASSSSFTLTSHSSYTRYPMSNRSRCPLLFRTTPHRLYSLIFRIVNCDFRHCTWFFGITPHGSYSFYLSLPPTYNIRFGARHSSFVLRVRSVPALNCSSYGLLQWSHFLVDTLPLVTSSPTGIGFVRHIPHPFDWGWCKSCSGGPNDAKSSICIGKRWYIWSKLGWRHDDLGPNAQHYGNLFHLLPPDGVALIDSPHKITYRAHEFGAGDITNAVALLVAGFRWSSWTPPVYYTQILLSAFNCLSQSASTTGAKIWKAFIVGRVCPFSFYLSAASMALKKKKTVVFLFIASCPSCLVYRHRQCW